MGFVNAGIAAEHAAAGKGSVAVHSEGARNETACYCVMPAYAMATHASIHKHEGINRNR